MVWGNDSGGGNIGKDEGGGGGVGRYCTCYINEVERGK